MKYCFLLLTLFLHLTVAAQSYNGKIVDEKGNPVPGATIVVSDKDGQVVAYAIAKEGGCFQLTIPKGRQAHEIKVDFVGYQKKSLPISALKDGVTITLKEGSFLLKEVKVKAQRIRAAGDTLTYSVAGFKQGQDRSIADVIAKMPGLEVKADGKIEYQGKSINKFYIEGADLMGSQYGMANQNISADKVKSVQVLENHQPMKSLRGVSFSDQAALNLVLKDDAKSVWTGTADVGLGYGKDFLYDCRLMGMCFGRKRQALMMYKNNDTGKLLDNEVFDLTDMFKGRSGTASGILSMMSVDTPDLSEERYTFNHSHLVAGNWLWKTGKDSELRLQGNGLVDKTEMQDYNASTYLTLADMPVIVEDEDVRNTRSEWKAEADYQYNGAKSFIRNSLKGYVNFNKSVGRMMYNRQGTDLMVKPRRRSLTEDFQLSHTTSKRNVYHVDSYWSYNYLPGQLLTINGMMEKLNLSNFSTQNSVLYKYQLGRHYLNNELGIDYDRQHIAVAMDEDAGQANTYHLLRAYWMPSVSFAFGRQQMEVKSKLSYAHQSYHESSDNHLWIDPSVNWNWKVSAVSAFSANVNYTNTPLDGLAIYDTPVFTTYRTQTVHRGKTSVTHSFRATATYKYSNPVLGLFFNVSPTYDHTSGNFLYESTMNGNVYKTTATDKEHATQSIGLAGRVSKSFGWAKTLVSLGVSHLTTDYGLLVSGQLDEARMSVTSVALHFSLRPARALSVEGRSDMNVTRQHNMTSPDLSGNNTNSWEHSLSVHIFPANSWMLSVKNHLFHSNSDGVANSYFLDLAVNYKSKRWELSLSAHNLIGTSAFEQRILGNTVETYTVTYLRPCEYLLKWAFDL